MWAANSFEPAGKRQLNWSQKNIIVENVQPFVSQRCPIVVCYCSGANWRLALALMAEMQADGCLEDLRRVQNGDVHGPEMYRVVVQQYGPFHSMIYLVKVVMFHGCVKLPEPKIVYFHKIKKSFEQRKLVLLYHPQVGLRFSHTTNFMLKQVPIPTNEYLSNQP